MSRKGPLDGLVVLESGTSVGSAFAGKIFADLGARVYAESLVDRFISVADGEASIYLGAYLDGRKLEGSVRDPDVVLRAPGVPEGEMEEHTVEAVFSPWGELGPQSSWQSTELVSQAAAGLASLIGEPDRAPLMLGGHQTAYSTGIMAFTGVMMALTKRDQDGQGQRVHVSDLETVAYMEWKGRIYEQAGKPLSRGETSGPVVIQCADGPFGFFYRATDWPAILSVLPDEALREPKFSTHGDRVARAGDFLAVLNTIAARFTRYELYALLQSVKIPVAPILNALDLLESPQYAHRRFLTGNPVLPGAKEPAFPAVLNGERPNHADAVRNRASAIKETV